MVELNKFIKKELWFFVILLFSILIGFIWFGDGVAKATGESGLFFINLGRHYELSRYAWVDSIIGETAFSYNGAIPLSILLKTLSVFLNPGIIEGIFFTFTVFIGSLGVSLIAREFFPKIKSIFLIFIGIAYTFNPYSIPFVWNRFLYNQIFSYGVIPILLYFWIRFIRKGDQKTLLIFYLLSFLASFAFTGIAFLLVFLLGSALFSINLITSVKSKKVILKRSLLLLLFFLFSQIFWFVSFYEGNRLAVSTSSSYFSESGNLVTTLKLSEYYGGILNKIRMIRDDMHLLAFEGIPWAKWYSTQQQFFLSFIPFFMLILSLLFIFLYEKTKKLILIIIFVFTLLLINGSAPPVGEIYLLIYKLHPVVQVLRNPYEKVGLLFYILFFIIWGSGMWLVYEKKSKRLGMIIYLISLIWWIAAAWPIFDGKVFTYKYTVSNDPKVGFRVKVPDYYTEARELINETGYLSRGLAIPITGEGVTHTWEYGYDGVESYNGLFDNAFISLDTTSGKLPEVSKMLKSQSIEDSLPVLSKFNISHVVIRRDLELPKDSPDIDNIVGILSQNASGKKISGGKLNIFTLDDDLQGPRIYATDDLKVTNRPLLNSETLSKNIISGFKHEDIKEESFDKILYPTNEIEESDISPLVKYEEVLSYLPHVKYPRGHILYPIVRIKEEGWKFLKEYESLSIQTTLSLKRLAEIDLLVKQGKYSELDNAIQDYKITLDLLLNEARLQLENSGDSQSFWWKTLRMHEMVLNRYEEQMPVEAKSKIVSLKEELVSNLKNIGVYPLYESKILKDENFFVKKLVYDIPEDALYNLVIELGIEDLSIGDQIQVDDNLLSLAEKLYREKNLLKINVELKKGKREIRIPIRKETIDLVPDQEIFDSLNKESNQIAKKLSLDIPKGKGEASFGFEYRIIKGQGPHITILQQNSAKPLIERLHSPDNYYYDWTQQYINLPFTSDYGKLTVDIHAIPRNDCIEENRYNSKCNDKAFREVYDRHSQFLIKNLQVTFKPDVKFSLDLTNIAPSNTNPNISWKRINPAIYQIDIDQHESDLLLVFLDQFHQGWSLYKINNDNLKTDVKFTGNTKVWKEYNVVEQIIKPKITDGIYYSLASLYPSSIEEKRHVTVGGYANGWLVDNSGSYILIFKPQRSLYFGWIVTFFGVSVFVYYKVKKRYHKRV